MEPRIQYAQTSDGVNIAYWTMGEGGTPLLMTAPALSPHISLEIGIPKLRAWYEHLAKNRMVIRYDQRGCGMSDRDVEHFSLDLLVGDVEAVVEALGLETLNLVGFFGPGGAALRFAACHPANVSKLALWQTPAQPDLYFKTPRGQALLSLLDQDWDLYTETLAHQLLGWRPGRLAHEWAAFIRQSTTQENEQKLLSAVANSDIDLTMLAAVRAETLVITHPQSNDDLRKARELASGIANSRVAVLQGNAGAPWDSESGTAALDDFFGEGTGQRDLPSGTAIILFLDIADSTALTTQLGDAAYREKERELDAALRSAIREAGGTPVEGKVLGDGIMAVFTSARQAIECALRCRAEGENAGLPLHLGIHAGDVVREGNNVHGGAVQLAARVATASAPGEILVSDTVRSLARTSAGVAFEDRGEHELKGIADPVRLFAVRVG